MKTYKEGIDFNYVIPETEGTTVGNGALTARSNTYYRIFRVDNINSV